MIEKKYKLKIKTHDGMTHTVDFSVPCGEDGYTPRKGIDYFDGNTPQRGVDYWTANDKEIIIREVLASLPNASGVSF